MKTLKKALIIFLILLLFIIVAFTLFIGYNVSEGFTLLTPREETLKNYEEYSKTYYEEFAEGKNIEEFSIPSSQYVHDIPCLYVDGGSDKLAVLVHGLGGTKKANANVAQIFIDLGYDVLMYDQRASGDNQAERNTFGYMESYDTLDVINYGRRDLSYSDELVLWGESFGGITAATAMGRDESNIDKLILDCSINNGEMMIRDVMIDMGVSEGPILDYAIFAGNLFLKLRFGFSTSDLNASTWLEDTTIPVLVLTSEGDELIPASQGIVLYDSINHEKKDIYISENASHAEIDTEDRENYIKAIEDFLSE